MADTTREQRYAAVAAYDGPNAVYRKDRAPWIENGGHTPSHVLHDIIEMLVARESTAAARARAEAFEECAWAVKKVALRTRHQAVENPCIAEDLMLQAEVVDEAEQAIRALAAKGAR